MKALKRGTCAYCGAEIKMVALTYNGRSVGRGWIHDGLEAALNAQGAQPHEASLTKRADYEPKKGRPLMAATKAPAAKTGKTTTAKVTKAAAPATGRGEKSAEMRALFSAGKSVAEVAKATGAHYSFAHGVYRRMIASGDIEGGATQPRGVTKAEPAKTKPARASKAAAPVAAPAKRQTAAQRQAAAKAGRPTPARRAANRKTEATAVEA